MKPGSMGVPPMTRIVDARVLRRSTGTCASAIGSVRYRVVGGRYSYLQEGVEDDFGDAALVYVTSFKEHFCRALANPSRNDQGAPSGARLLRWRWVDAHVDVCGGRMAAVHCSECLNMALTRMVVIHASQVRM